jgi:hypothetical protein
MSINTPADHKIITSSISTIGSEAEHILQAIDLELTKLMKNAVADGRIVISHTVTFFDHVESVVLTLHTVKA